MRSTPAPVGEQLQAAHREEVEVRQPERDRHQQAEHGAHDHADPEPGASGPEADGDQGLADRDDHDQAVPLDEVCRPHSPAARAGEQRTEQTDHERSQPEQGPEPAVEEPRRDDQGRAGEGRGSAPQDRRQKVSVSACSERVEREVHDVHDEEGDPEDDTVLAERFGDGQRGDEHRRHRNQHRPPDRALIGIDSVRQPRVSRPRPPERAEDQEAVREPAPRRIVRQHRRDLRESEDEDEVEEELERGDALLPLGVLLAHRRTLTREVGGRNGNGTENVRGVT